VVIKHTRDIPLFESLGLFTEAPKKKRKPRVISVSPIKKDYYDELLIDNEQIDIDDESDDFSDYDDIGLDDLSALDEELQSMGSDDIPDDITDDDIENEPALGEDLIGNVEPQETGEEVTEPTKDEVPTEEPVETGTQVEDPQDQAETTGEEVTEPVDGEIPSEEPVPEGNEVIDTTTGEGSDPEAEGDLGGDVELDSVPEDGSDPTQTPVDGQDPNAAPEQQFTKDDIRKHELYKRFMQLYKTIQYFIDKLENGVSDDERFEYIAKVSLDKFKSLEDLTRDYMLLKYQTDSYLQNSFFFEKIKASCLLIFELISSNKNKNADK